MQRRVRASSRWLERRLRSGTHGRTIRFGLWYPFSGVGHARPARTQSHRPASSRMASNARDRALALVSALEPTDLVPCRILAELLAEVEAAPSPVAGPPHPDGWTTKALAAYYECGVSTMRGRIEGGEFGLPETEGGPRKAGRRGWLVPHYQVLARDERVQRGLLGALIAPATVRATGPFATRPEPTASVTGPRGRAASASSEKKRLVGTPSLRDARRQRSGATAR